MEGKQIVCYLYFFLSLFYSNTLNDIYVDSAQVEVERIDIGEPENTGMHHIVWRVYVIACLDCAEVLKVFLK